MRCSSCQFDNPEGMNFCGKCAAPLAPRCPQCGFENPPGFAFCGKCATSLSGKSKGKNSPPHAQSPTPNTQHPAERRQLTVMFCDLVGSTALSEQLDPEELREVIHAYQQTSAEVIERYEGHIAQYLGDGLLVYFGYPAAHEDDAVRAVRVGLEIVAALQQPNVGARRRRAPTDLSMTPPLQVRIGIHTGLVVVGEVGGGAKREQLALGETPNIAARVQGQAAPNTVVVSAATLRLLHGLFATEDLGQQALKGIATPMDLYRVRGENIAQHRFEATLHPGLLPLIGRELEIEMLRDRWQRVVQGAGQVVLLSGEPGIGKSRLVQTLRELTLSDGVTQVELQCSPYHQNSAYYPIIEHLQRFLKFARDDSPQEKLHKLEVVLQRRGGVTPPLQSERVLLFAALLSLPHPEGAPPLTLSPQKQKEKTQEAIIAWIVEEAERAPVYCAGEDLHWADPSTLDLLTLLLAQVPTTRLLMLLTFRPEFAPPWGPRSYLSQLTLSRLGQSHVEAMVGTVTGGKTLAPEILQQIVAKTDGVPLFVEELTKTVVETLRQQATGNGEQEGAFVGAQHARPVRVLGIPTTLQDALMARLDRLGAVKEIAQMGATIGREFTYDVLHAVSPLAADTLQQGLRQLVDAELLYQRGVPPQATYLFKHALVQDTAYQSLLKSTRQQLHQQIAEVLEARFVEIKETQPELLAHHYTEAGLIEQAIPYWQQAGERATRRSANVEAVAHLTKGIELVLALPHTPERDHLELGLQTTLGLALIAAKGFGSPEVGETYSRARELCQQVGETPQLFQVLRGLWAFYNTRSELRTARELGEQFLSLAQSAQNPALLLEAHRAMGRSFFDLGEFLLARAHLERGLALYDPLQHGSHAFLYGHDPGVAGLSCMALVLWHLGYPDEALKRNHEALALARDLDHPFSLAFAFLYANRLCQFRRDGQIAQEQAETAVLFSREHGFPIFVAEGAILRGWTLAEQGQKKEGIEQMRQGIAAWRVTGAEMWQSNFLALLAEGYGKVGQVEEGLTVLAEALAQIDKTGERFYEAELYRIKGELLLAQAKQRVTDTGQP